MTISIQAISNQKLKLSTPRYFWLIAGIAILYGIHLRFSALQITKIDTPIRADARDYFIYAKNLKRFNTFSRTDAITEPISRPKPDALRSPGFPFFAAFFMSSSVEQSLHNVLWAQTILQIFSFLLLSFMLYKLMDKLYCALAIVLIWTFPHFVSINTYFLSESLFTSLLSISIFFFWYFYNYLSTQKVGLILVGLLVGLSALIRPVIEYLPLFIAFSIILFSRKHLKQTIIFTISALIPILMWKIRNIVAIGELSDTTLMINGLYHGSFPNFMHNNDPRTFGFPYRFDPRQQEVYQGVGATLKLIIERFIDNPWGMSKWYIFGKQTYLWQWSIIAGYGDIFIYPIKQSPYLFLPDMMASHVAHRALHWIWVITGLITAILIFTSLVFQRYKDNPVWLLSALIIVYVIIVHTILAPFPRYGISFKIFLIPLSLYGIRVLHTWSISQWKKIQKP